MLLAIQKKWDPKQLERSEMTLMNALDIYRRRQEISVFYYYNDDVLRITRGFPDVDFRILLRPSHTFDEPILPETFTEEQA